MKELAFQTTSTRDKAVESPKTCNLIDSAVAMNSTSGDRDAKTVNETQLQEGAELPEITKVQNMDPCTGVFDRPATAKHDETEEEMGLDRLAVVDQDFEGTLPLIHFKSFAVVPGLTSLVDWEYARMNKREQWEFLYSICEYCESLIEATQPQTFLRKFNCFPKLPLEMRRKIWFYALPEPCLVELNLYRESDHVAFFGGSELVSAKIWRTIKKTGAGYFIPSQLLLVCRESHDFFLEHYSIMDLQSLPGNEVISDDTINSSNYIFHASSRGYIDIKSDTLVIRNLQVVVEDLLFFNMHLNPSVITKLSIHTSEVEYFVDPNNGREIFGGLPSHLWKHIETLFPHLKQLTFIQNTCRDDRSVNQGELDLNPLSINCLQPINDDTVGFLLECIAKSHYHVDHERFIPKPYIRGQSALDHSMVYKSQYLERVHNDPDYWGGIEFETSLLINFQPDYDFYVINRKSANQKDLGGDSSLLITRADSYSGTISLYFEDWMDNLSACKDETFYNDYGLK
ncbi:hypothetical protein BHYA_0154g00180 [Botrytis hyacinthi]|uniref:2EXR domain-containing protein n=1 Tax=Botrytis hyacinthi TaxID=278943 RepID=A0A4Z1GF32_9HELO|nr:hypothetical protein BHYA_0154g00180 [Botrytis hyacinthi]